MKYCSHCGQQLNDEATVCLKCGCPCEVVVNADVVGSSMPTNNATPTSTVSKDSTLKLIAFIFCLLSTISLGWLILPLAWCLPMTIAVYRAYKGERKLSVGFNICVLLFVNMIAGILLLVDND